ncbi:MAG: type II secretion system protein GspG [Phycisphaeraceae bacterium]|nr:type II secretion system protein GspG [Phycisphaerales bacterium]MCB9860971.1 type II secretion system protein GspG [Phycisphaeraceae bacterium]
MTDSIETPTTLLHRTGRFGRRMIAWATAAGFALIAGSAFAQSDAQKTDDQTPDIAPFMQVVDDPTSVTMQMAVRTLVPADGQGPTITLFAAIHIGDRSFYDAIQQMLDAKDLVLFEGVRPTGAGYIAHEKDMTERDRNEFTERRMKFLGSSVVTYKASHRAYPETLNELSEGVDERIGRVIAGIGEDAWGHQLVYERDLETGTFELRSAGSDGELHNNDDIVIDPASDGVYAMETDTEGIQTILAESLGLVFQLDAMDESGPNWRNSDLSIDQVMERLDEAGVTSFELMDTLQGNTIGTKIAGFFLKLIGKSKTMRETAKLALVEMLGSAEDLLGALPGEMGTLMQVILEQRNDVLLADVAHVIEHEPEVKNLGIIYGAGHLRDVQARLETEFGYVHKSDEWVDAMSVDLKALGMTQKQAQSMRTMLRRQINAQMKMLERQR